MKFENTEVFNIGGALRGMRNPLESWGKSDSSWEFVEDPAIINPNDEIKFVIGESDMKLAQKLIRAGSEHRKFMRQIFVSVDITAPLYWIHEFDTYKIGTSRNSCSLQHKGASRPFTIRDFSVDERIYEILEPTPKTRKEHKHTIPYDTEEYKEYSIGERRYKVFKNGKIVACAFSYTDNYGTGRNRFFEEREIVPSQYPNGYWYCQIGGRVNSEKWLIHRLVAKVWMPNDDCTLEINHIDGNKGNNSVENLEWVTRSENELHKHRTGLVDDSGLHTRYLKFKNSQKVSLKTRIEIKKDAEGGILQKDLSEKYGISQPQISAIINDHYTSNENELFYLCQGWENIIDNLNKYRELYVETKDYNYFKIMRQIMPQAYNYKFTWTATYENILNMVRQRKNHKLNEWSGIDNPNVPNFISWARTLPYAQELIFIDELEKETNV